MLSYELYCAELDCPESLVRLKLNFQSPYTELAGVMLAAALSIAVQARGLCVEHRPAAPPIEPEPVGSDLVEMARERARSGWIDKFCVCHHQRYLHVGYDGICNKTLNQECDCTAYTESQPVAGDE